MSSRRAVGEDNILAMLERDSARRTGNRISSLHLAWYGAAAALAGILAGGVAWLAYDNHKSGAQLQAGYDAALAQVPPAQVPPAVSGAGAQPEATPTLQAPTADAPRTAVIVDESVPAPQSAPAVPPLVMLPPYEVAAARRASQAAPALPAPASHTAPPLVMLPANDAPPPRPPASVRAQGSAPARTAAPGRASRDTASAAPAKARGTQVAARAAGEKKANKTKMDKTQRANVRTAKAAPPRNAPKAAESGTRQRKANASEAPVDSDVALISAIIAQSERHRGERDAAAECRGSKCP
jgi:hypothetical protein